MPRSARRWILPTLLTALVIAVAAVSVWWFAFRDTGFTRFGGGEPSIVVVGDSYTSGIEGNATPWPELLAADTGRTVASAAVSGSGYSVDDDSFRTQLARLDETDPEFVVLVGSRNDFVRHNTFPEAATGVWDAAAATFPDSEIVVIGPLRDATAPPGVVSELDATMAAAAEAEGVRYVSGLAWLAGHTDMMLPDGVHPNDEGQRLLADRVIEALGL